MERTKIRAFANKLFADMAGAMAAGMVYVGVETGLFEVMAGKGALSAEAVAAHSGLEPRYVEEWLMGMVAAGYLDYEPGNETFSLPDERAYLLASDGTDHFAGGLFGVVPFMMAAAPEVADAFRNGGGVPFQAYGKPFISALDAMNRGNFEIRLVERWLPALPDVVERLAAGGRVLDLGCGAGSALLALAKALPESQFVGLDLDANSIQKAREKAHAAGLDGRIQFLAQDIVDWDESDRFDLITAFDTIHDLAEPHTTLRHIHKLLKPGGTLFIAEPKVSDRLEDNVNPIATMFYGFSLLHCMTQSLAQGGAGLGACMGQAQMESMVREAGFGQFEPLAISSPLLLFYAARH
jgi:2-polyprenyl-3-methyl-5-hydroxy-6-metoxy-1,4-benzoquinol methylase